jgi:adenylyltransferase/sulfurtransferase
LVPQIRPRELAIRLANGHPVYLLDVRQPWEHETAALPDSHLIPLNQLPARAGEIQATEAVPVVVYCHHGIRSLSAAEFLLKSGRRNVASLAGGIDAWSEQVDPTVPRY